MRILLPAFYTGCCLIMLAGCSKPATRVQTQEVTSQTLFARVTESGTISPTIDVPISPDVPGEVVIINVREGMKVAKGDLLMTILPDDYQSQLEQAQASLSRSRAAYLQAKASQSQSHATLLQDSVSLARTKKLFEDGVVSKVDLENAQLSYSVSKSQYESARYNVDAAYYQVKSSEATTKQAKQNLNRTNIYASMDGTITQLNVELGQRVVGTSMMAGTEILKIADLSSMEVIVEINENDIVNVKLGDSTRVEVDAFPDKIFYGEVSEIAYSASTSGMSTTDQVTNFEVKVRISPASYQELAPTKGVSPFRPGMTALVEIYTNRADDVISVPIQAVTLRSGQAGGEADEVVFVYDNGAVNQVPITTGISDDRNLEIKSGLEGSEEIVIGPYQVLSQMLKDGMQVEKGEATKMAK